MQMEMHTPAAPLPHYLLLLASFFLLLPFAAPSDIALLLAKVKPALQGAAATPNAQLATWNASTPLCLWRGLRWSTPAGHPLPCHTAAARANLSLADDPTLLLVSIRLPAAALAGRLPPDLGAFSALASLYLAANSLSGPIPLELVKAPALSGLDLSGNALSGVLPPSIWNLCDRLAVLRLHGNALTGAIPKPAGPNTTCDRLRLLDLGANRFSGDFPSFLTGFRGLQSLDLGGNRLSGSIPDSLAGMGGLQTLNLSYNNFSGQLPPGFADSAFTAESFLGNNPSLCGPLLRQQCVSPSGHSSRGIAGMVIGLMASAVVVASVSIGWALGRWRRNRVKRAAAEGVETDEGGKGKLVVFQGREHLTPEEVRNATGQVVEKASHCTVYKAKLADGGGNIDPNAAAPARGDWRAQLQPEARNRIVSKIMETLKKHLPVSVPEGLNELQKIAVRFEEKIYTAATSQSDYLRKISLKMLSMETKTQQPPGNAQVIPNQNPSGPASVDSTAQTGHAGAGDWQEEIYQMVKSLKDQYFAELSELYNRISVKLQHVDSMIPPQKPSDQYERMKSFKMMLERTLQVLQINKNNIQPALREKLPLYEKQIINILNSQRRKPVQTQGQQQFQQSTGQAPSSNISQQQQPSHDSHTNQMPQASLPSMSTGLQSSSAAGIQHVPAPPATNFGVPTTQQNVANAPQAGSNLEAAQGSNFNSSQHGSTSGALQQGSTGPMQSTMNAQQQASSSMLSHNSMSTMQPNANSMQANASSLQQPKQQQQEHHMNMMQNHQMKRQMPQQLQQKQMLQQQLPIQQQLQKQQQAQIQVPQLHSGNDVNELKVREGAAMKTGIYQQHLGQRSNYYHQQLKKGGAFPISSPQNLQASSPQISHHSPQVDQHNLLLPPIKTGTPLHSANSPFVPSPSPSVAPSPIPVDSDKPLSNISSLTNTGQAGHQQTSLAPQTQSIAVNTPGISASPLLAEFTSADGSQANIPTQVPTKSSAAERPLDRLLKVLRTTPRQSLSAAVSDIGSVVSMIDRIAGSAPGNGSRAAVGEDLVAMTKCRLQARNFITHDGSGTSKKMKRDTSAMPLNVSSAGSVNDSFKQTYSVGTPELQSTATSHAKWQKTEVNHALVEEIQEINQQLIDTELHVCEDVAESFAATSEGAEGTVIKCTFTAVAVSPSLKSMFASARMSPILPLRLLVPASYPKCSPVLLDKFPDEQRNSDDLSTKAKSKFGILLRGLPEPMSLREIARTWDACARKVIAEYAQQTGGGSFSSSYGCWESCVGA